MSNLHNTMLTKLLALRCDIPFVGFVGETQRELIIEGYLLGLDLVIAMHRPEHISAPGDPTQGHSCEHCDTWVAWGCQSCLTAEHSSPCPCHLRKDIQGIPVRFVQAVEGSFAPTFEVHSPALFQSNRGVWEVAPSSPNHSLRTVFLRPTTILDIAKGLSEYQKRFHSDPQSILLHKWRGLYGVVLQGSATSVQQAYLQEARKILDNIAEFAADTSELDNSELDALLREEGIKPESLVDDILMRVRENLPKGMK